MCILKEDLIIKEVEKKEDFKKVFKVFREYPYNELWPDIEIEEEFKKIKDIGRVIGCYYKENCIGIITFYDIIRNEHPITYGKNNKVLYFSDIAVLKEFRNNGIATKLLKYMIEFATTNAYDIIYMRTMQPDKSMSYSMVVKNGFTVVNGVTEDKKMSRVSGNVESDQRIFLEYIIKEEHYE